MYEYIVSVTAGSGPLLTVGADTKEEARAKVEAFKGKFADHKVEAFSTRTLRAI